MKLASKYARLLLLAPTAVAALVGARCYEAPAPKDATFPFVSYLLAGGSSAGDPVQVRSVSVMCWADTTAGASALYAALRDGLFGVDVPTWRRLSDVTVFGISQTGSETRYVDPSDGKEALQFTMSFAMPVE